MSPSRYQTALLRVVPPGGRTGEGAADLPLPSDRGGGVSVGTIVARGLPGCQVPRSASSRRAEVASGL